jgi:GH24 family phage-related lysozyme (muramidase)
MAERPQVRQFQAPTQADLKPMASPVDTFVGQPKDYTQPSPLSQFLTAITPAMEADANQRKIERLKREKEIADGIERHKKNQLKQESNRFLGSLADDFIKNSDAYMNLEMNDVYEKVRAAKNEYIGQLADKGMPQHLQFFFDDEVEAGLESFVQTSFKTEKYKFTHGKLKEQFEDNVLVIQNNYNNGLYKTEDGKLDPQQAIQAIQDLYVTFHQDNSDFFKPSDNQINDALKDIALGMKDTDPNNIVGQYMESEVSKKQFGSKGRYVKNHDDLLQARATHNNKTAKAEAKSAALAQVVFNSFETQSITSVNDQYYVDPTTGNRIKLTSDEIEFAVLNSDMYKKLGDRKLGGSAGQQLRYLARVGIVPTRMKGMIRDGAKFLVAGADVSQAGDLETLEIAIGQYSAMKNAGMDMSWLSDDQRKKMDALIYVSKDMAKVGEVELVDTDLLNDPYDESEAYVTKANLSNAARIVQKVGTFDGLVSDKEFREAVQDNLSGQGGWINTWFGTTLDDVYNSETLINDIVKGAYTLYSTGEYQDFEHAAKVAANIAWNDYKVVESSDGTQYAFKHLNTDYSATMDVQSTVNEYNKTLEPLVAGAMAQQHGLKKGEYVVALHPHLTNPNEVSIRIYDVRGEVAVPIGTLGRGLDKKTLFTDPAQLNNLVAKSLEGAGEKPVTTYTTSNLNDNASSNINNALDNSLRGSRKTRRDNIGTEETTTETSDTSVDNQNLSGRNKTRTRVQDDEPTDDNEPEADDGITADDVETISSEFEDEQSSLLDTAKDTLASVGEGLSEVNPFRIDSLAAATILDEEGFEATPYTDDLRDGEGKKSVGHGLQIASLEPDERALIKDINNVTEEESKAVVNLKVNKISKWWDETVEGFSNLPDSSQVAAINMAFQLGKENVKNEWPKFMASIEEAATHAEGSVEQGVALAKAQFNMLYNQAENGVISATKWATQTTNRAVRMGEMMVADAKVAGAGMVEAVSEAVLPSAQASTITPTNVGQKPKGEDVVAMAASPDLISAALEYMGMTENSKNGAKAVEGMFNSIVGGKAFKGTPEEVAKGNAWCAAFLAQVLADAGIDANKLIGGKDKYAATRAKSYLKVGKPVDIADVKAGDIMVAVHSQADRDKYFREKGQKLTSFGHVGIVVEAKDGELYYIGGNTGDKVKVSSYGMGKKDLRIRRIDGVTKPDVDNLPSIREMEWGVAGTAVDKLENAWKSMVDFFK